MRGKIALIAGVGLGSGLMYLFDPDRGKQRRSLVRDRAKRTSRYIGRMAKTVDKTAHDLAKGTNELTRRVFALKRKALRLVA
jgi:hypothetical protein